MICCVLSIDWHCLATFWRPMQPRNGGQGLRQNIKNYRKKPCSEKKGQHENPPFQTWLTSNFFCNGILSLPNISITYACFFYFSYITVYLPLCFAFFYLSIYLSIYLSNLYVYLFHLHVFSGRVIFCDIHKHWIGIIG